MWELVGFEIQYTLRMDAVCWQLEFSPNEKFLATAGGDKHIRLWDVETGEPSAVLRAHVEAVRCLSFSSHGLLITGGMDDWMCLWEPENPVPVRQWMGYENADVVAVQFSPADPDLAVSVGMNGQVAVWRVLNSHAPNPWAVDNN